MIILKKYLDGVVIYLENISIALANGQKIKCSGQATLNLAVNHLKRVFTWAFVIADTANTLLGYDYENHFLLTVVSTDYTETNRESNVQAASGIMNNDNT